MLCVCHQTLEECDCPIDSDQSINCCHLSAKRGTVTFDAKWIPLSRNMASKTKTVMNFS